MKHLEGILKLIENELEAIEKNGKFRSREEIDSVYKLVDIAKDVYCIWEYEDGDGEDESSYGMGGSYARGGRGGSYRGGSYDDDMSYARGRGRNARRDSMGRYSRNDGSYERYDGYSRRGGYSRDDGKEEYVEHLRDMMESAPDEETRKSIKRMIEQMDKA